MAIQREDFDYDGNIIIVCDVCGYAEETETDNWSRALAVFRAAGGEAYKTCHGEWEHVCRECQ